MTGRAQLRKTALGLPGVQERTVGPERTYRVDGAPFVRVDADDWVHLALTDADCRSLSERHPRAQFSQPGSTAQLRQVSIALDDLNGQQLNHWVRRAWHANAPREASAAQSAAERAVAGQVGDLPRALGNPATHALLSAGVSSLAAAAEWTDHDLLALHGVGPRAVQVLRQAIAAADLAPTRTRDG